MTPLEIVGAFTLAAVGSSLIGRMVFRLLNPVPRHPMIEMDVASKQLQESVREAFESGMLCAADIATHEGHEALAGRIRKTVEYVQGANDN
jgi:hypothetical protein